MILNALEIFQDPLVKNSYLRLVLTSDSFFFKKKIGNLSFLFACYDEPEMALYRIHIKAANLNTRGIVGKDYAMTYELLDHAKFIDININDIFHDFNTFYAQNRGELK